MAKEEEKIKSPSILTFDMLRVTPTPVKRDVNPKTDRLTDILIILFILGISFWYRFYFFTVFNDVYGFYDRFNVFITDGDPLGFGSFLGLETGDRINSEGYYDFTSYYIPYVNAFEEGWNPYTGSRSPDDSIGGYVYGPYYMVSIAIGKLWFGLNTVDSIIYSNILLDSLTYVMVYILVKRYTGNLVALAIALIGSFSPISLFYIAFRGLNAPIMNFSFLLFIYFYLERRDNLSMIVLAFSLLTKQFPLFMAMPVGLWMVRRYGFFKGLSFYLRGVMAVLILSIPYILWTPRDYVVRLFLPGGSKSIPACPNNSEATNLFHGMIPDSACNVGGDGNYLPLDTSQMPNGYGIVFDLVNTHILFFGCLIILAWIGFTGYDYLERRPQLYFVFFAAYYGIAHATIARGIYKYYITFLVPLFIMGFMFGHRGKSLHLRLGYLLHHGWQTWFNPKYRQKEATVIFWLFGSLLLGLTFGILWLVTSAVNMFTFNSDKTLFWSVIFVVIAIYCIFRPGPYIEHSSDELVDLSTYQSQLSIYILLTAIGAYFLNKVAKLYFGENSTSIALNIILLVLIVVGIIVVPYLQSQVTGDSRVYSPFTMEYRQLVLDIISFLVAFMVLKFFHVQVLLIHRFDTTLFILLFSFIPLALLGNQVWGSGLHSVRNFVYQVKRIYWYVNLRLSSSM